MGQACNSPDESLPQSPLNPPEPLCQHYDPNVVNSCFTHAVSWFLCHGGFVEQEIAEHIVKHDDKYEEDHNEYTRWALTYAVGQEYKGREKNPRNLSGVVVKGSTEDIEGWGPGVFIAAQPGEGMEAIESMIQGLAEESREKHKEISPR